MELGRFMFIRVFVAARLKYYATKRITRSSMTTLLSCQRIISVLVLANVSKGVHFFFLVRSNSGLIAFLRRGDKNKG